MLSRERRERQRFRELYYQYNDKWENECCSEYSWKVKQTDQVQKGQEQPME